MRLSTGDAQTTYKRGKKRVMGVAVKLFPTQDERASVTTSNLFFLDWSGLEGDARPRFLGPGENDEPVVFRNQATGTSWAARRLTEAFRKLDNDPTTRPVYPLTEIDAHGRAVVDPVTPKLVYLIPQATGIARGDFREEILAYGSGIRFLICLEKSPVGTLVLGRPVLSAVCDQELYFHHHPNR